MDLVLAVIALALLAASLLYGAMTVTRRTPSWVSSLLALGTLTLMVVFAMTLYGDLDLARFLPFSAAVVLGNMVPVGAAVLMGIVLGQRNVPFWRRVAIASMLGSLAWYTVFYDLMAPSSAVGRPRFIDGFCAQTTMTSCSACSGAALLQHHRISASEREMVDLCLTRKDGTPELGLFRGLKLKTRGTGLQVRPLPEDLATIRRQSMLPAILFIDVSDQRVKVPWWRPRCTTHSIVLFGFTDHDMAVIGDPSCGMSRWLVSDLEDRWQGKGLWLDPAAD